MEKRNQYTDKMICPECGGELVYDKIFNKYVCVICGAIYSIDENY